MKIKIEKGIGFPIERRNHTLPKTGTYGSILDKMSHGDSFKITNKTQSTSVYVAAYRRGITVTIRAVKGGYRVWRVK